MSFSFPFVSFSIEEFHRRDPIAPWELRLGDVRVFYAVEEKPEPRVTVAAVGVKHHNELRIGKERIEL
jgi:hypothetical protein